MAQRYRADINDKVFPRDLGMSHMCSKYGFGIVMSEGIIDVRLIVMLLVGMSWADVLSVMLARGVMCDVRHPHQEEAL